MLPDQISRLELLDGDKRLARFRYRLAWILTELLVFGIMIVRPARRICSPDRHTSLEFRIYFRDPRFYPAMNCPSRKEETGACDPK
jgi:hypothetical protein